MVVGGLTVVSGRFGGAPGSSGQRWLGCVWLWSGVGGLVTVWWRSGGGVVCWFGGGLLEVVSMSNLLNNYCETNAADRSGRSVLTLRFHHHSTSPLLNILLVTLNLKP